MIENQEIVKFSEQFLQQQRIDQAEISTSLPIHWQGLDMTLLEAKLLIQELEKQQFSPKQTKHTLQQSGAITNIVTTAVGMAAMVTGANLMLFPLLHRVGMITMISGIGLIGIGRIIGDGIIQLGINHQIQTTQQITADLDALKTAIINTISS